MLYCKLLKHSRKFCNFTTQYTRLLKYDKSKQGFTSITLIVIRQEAHLQLHLQLVEFSIFIFSFVVNGYNLFVFKSCDFEIEMNQEFCRHTYFIRSCIRRYIMSLLHYSILDIDRSLLLWFAM